MIKENNNYDIDEIYYSRQILALGIDEMKKLTTSSVFISRMNGLGAEIAKNIILSGFKSVIIHDTHSATIDDLASNIFLTENSIGKNRAIESFEKLSKLNENVTIYVKTESLTNDLIICYY